MPIILTSINEWTKLNIPHDTSIQSALKKIYQASSIQLRFDTLCLLLSECQNYLFRFPKGKIALNAISNLQKDALQIAMAIVDALTEEEFTLKLAARNKYKLIEPQFMPWHLLSTQPTIQDMSSRKDYVKHLLFQAFKTIGQKRYSPVNSSDATSDIKHHVLYLTEVEREKYRIFPSNKKLKTLFVKNYPLNEQNLYLDDFNTRNYNAHKNPNRAIFIISPRGDIYAGSSESKKFHHSSFLAGNAVFFAGTISVVHGRIQYLEDYSGHYKPKPLHSIQALQFLRKCGLLEHHLDYKMWGYSELGSTEYKIHFFNPHKPSLDPHIKHRIVSIIKELETTADNYLTSTKLLEKKKRNFLLCIIARLGVFKNNPLITPKNIDQKIEEIVAEEASQHDMKEILSGGSWPRSQKTKNRVIKLLEPKGADKLKRILENPKRERRDDRRSPAPHRQLVR